MELNELAKEIHEINVDNGFWTPENLPDFGMIIALIHSEASEALEEYRNGRLPFENYYYGRDPKKPHGIPSEFADIIMRVLDACAAYGIDIDKSVREKIEYNKTRGYLHGGKLA